jgi:cytochrome c oxidase cbb3-type subunit 3
MPTKAEKDAFTGTEIRDHEWDGLRELNTPLPKWWVWVFVATIVWAAVYVVLYPSLPGLDGITGWTKRGELPDQLAAARAGQAHLLDRIAAADLATIAADADLADFAQRGGRAAFANNCATCHGNGGAGRPDYPVLADDDWLWGGTLEAIETTIRHGVRAADPDTRVSEMPAFGADALLAPDQIADVAEHVLSLSGRAEDAAAAARGAVVFAENCAVCHGEDGRGLEEMGAPDLADAIWLYGGERDQIVAIVDRPRAGMMPSWTGRLDETTIKMLALYVHGLGGGR